MGSQFTDWAQATGPMYMGANGIMEVVCVRSSQVKFKAIRAF